MSASTAIGVGLACTAATMNTTGINLQRVAKRRGSTLLNGFGIFLTIACWPVDMISFSFAPQSFLAPFGALSLVVNLLLAPLLHGDAIKPLDVGATALVVSGVALCLANNTVDQRKWTLDELQALANGSAFFYWLLFEARSPRQPPCVLLARHMATLLCCSPSPPPAYSRTLASRVPRFASRALRERGFSAPRRAPPQRPASR